MSQHREFQNQVPCKTQASLSLLYRKIPSCFLSTVHKKPAKIHLLFCHEIGCKSVPHELISNLTSFLLKDVPHGKKEPKINHSYTCNFFLIKNKIKQTISRFLYKFEFKAISVIKKHENTTSLYYINRQFS